MKSLIIVIAVFFTLTSCALNQEIIILNTNDSHGIVLPKDGLGGLAQRIALIKEERRDNKNILLLDAGDINSGDYYGLTSNITTHIEAYNYMGYDAMAVGDHDMNRMISDIRHQESVASFPFLSSNIRFDGKLLFKPYIIKNYNGFRIGIFGVTTCLTPVYQQYTKYIEFENAIISSRRVVKELIEVEKVDMVIALSHLGIRGTGKRNTSSIELAHMVSGIDLIIDGHSHTLMNQQLVLGKTRIVSAYRDGLYVGRGVISVKGGKYAGFTWKLLAVKNYTPDKGIESIINQRVVEKEYLMLENIGFVNSGISSEINDQHISQAGILITNALMFGSRNMMNVPRISIVKSDVSHNSTLKSGRVSKKDIFDFIKDNNEVVVVSLRGDKLRRFFDEIAKKYEVDGVLPQISYNVRFVIDTVSNKVNELLINGKNIDYSATYNIVTTSDIAGEDVLYKSILLRQSYFESASSLSAWLTGYVEATKEIHPRMLNVTRFE